MLLQRLLTAATLIHFGILYDAKAPWVVPVAPQVVVDGAGVLLLVGLWTPVAGLLLAIGELWIAFSYSVDPWIHIMVAVLGASLAGIGPGAFSIDARFFGRRHIDTPDI